jgi:hypothetical protein
MRNPMAMLRRRVAAGPGCISGQRHKSSVAKQTLSRELRAMGYRKLSARPRPYAGAAGAIEDFKKASPRAWTQSRVRRRSASTR